MPKKPEKKEKKISKNLPQKKSGKVVLTNSKQAAKKETRPVKSSAKVKVSKVEFNKETLRPLDGARGKQNSRRPELGTKAGQGEEKQVKDKVKKSDEKEESKVKDEVKKPEEIITPEVVSNNAASPELPSRIVSSRQMTVHGMIEPQPLAEEMRRSYLDYAMSVIVSRALPDVRDGLKPVHRRILYAMWDIGLRASGKFRKSATVVGEVLGKYHPHGDSSVYEAMVRMARDFSMRYPLVKGQGNFGSMDGDGAAAMRYTEAKMAHIAEELLFDIDKDTVSMIPNYDGSHKEPSVMPAKLPNLLLNGAMGIAVGMATNIPPHNLRELVQAITHLIDNPEATVEDLMKFVKGPDFPTGGIMYNSKDILQIYATGRGGVIVRGKAEIEETKTGMFQIIIYEIPYGVNKATLVEKIADLVKDKKIEGIRDLRDESDKDGVRVVIDLKKDSYPKKILNSLFKHTQLQETFHANMLALVDGIQPKVLTLKTILEEYIKHRENVIKRRTQFDLEKAKDRAHILDGLMIALSNIDAVIKTIKASRDREEAKNNLIKKFKLSEKQSIAILEMRLQNLANLEQLKIETELKEKKKLIKELEAILASRAKIKSIIQEEITAIAEKYGDDRRTQVVSRGITDFSVEDLIPNEEVVVMMTRDGYIKRMPPDTFKVQGRGGKGVIGLTTKEEDMIEFMFTTMTHADILFFTTKGRAFQLKAHEIPQSARTAKGQAIVNFLQLLGDEKVTSILPLDKLADTKYLFFATENGLVKKVELSAFGNVRRSGLIALKLKDNDKLIWVKPTCGSDHVQLITANGQAIRFNETDVRDMGRGASGVHGIRLKKGDAVVGMAIINTENKDRLKHYEVLSIMSGGFGKRTQLHHYKVQGRGGSGIKTAKITTKTGKLTNAFIVDIETMTDRDLVIISEKGQVIRLPFKSVNQSGRDTQGVRLMRFKEAGDKVAGVTWV